MNLEAELEGGISSKLFPNDSSDHSEEAFDAMAPPTVLAILSVLLLITLLVMVLVLLFVSVLVLILILVLVFVSVTIFCYCVWYYLYCNCCYDYYNDYYYGDNSCCRQLEDTQRHTPKYTQTRKHIETTQHTHTHTQCKKSTHDRTHLQVLVSQQWGGSLASVCTPPQPLSAPLQVDKRTLVHSY